MAKNEEILRKIGQTLQTVRRAKKLTQIQVANKTKISRGTIAKYEKGLRMISEENDKILSNVLGVDSFLKDIEDDIAELLFSLNKFQEKKDLTNETLARSLGISLSVFSRIKNGERSPNSELQERIWKLLFENDHELMMNVHQDNELFSFPHANKAEMGKRIYHIRKKREETLSAFGKGFTKTVGKNIVSRWEKGINIPDIERLMNIAYFGNTTVTYLLYGRVYEGILVQPKDIAKKFEKPLSICIGRRLRKIRKDFKEEREVFGKYFNPPITKWSMDRYENGKDLPNTERLIQYAYIGSLSIEFLIYGEFSEKR